jgi:sulfoquinovosidase
MRLLAVVTVVLALGCTQSHAEFPRAEPLPFDHELRTPYAGVEVQEEPLSFRIVDGEGRVLLSTLGVDAAGGYAPVAWTEGTVRYETVQSPAYTAFSADLAPWQNRFEVDDVWRLHNHLGLRLIDPEREDAPPVLLSFDVRPHVVRVEMQLEGHSPRAWSVGFETPQDEAFLGFGERYNRTNQRGINVYNWTEEGGVGVGEGTLASSKNPWPNGEVMTGYPVPFFLSSKGYGFWLDTTYRSEFELASKRADAFRVWHVGPTMAFEVFVPERRGGPIWTYQVIDAFTQATGRPALPPKWAFGPRRRVSSSSVVRDVPEIELMRTEDLAVTAVDDAMHFFPNASHQGREATLSAWIARASQLGYRVNGYYNSLVADDAKGPMAALLDQGLREQYFLRRADGSLPDLWIYTGGRVVRGHLVDFTRPTAVTAYQSTFEWSRELGYAGFMYDFGEYVPWNVVAANGMTGEELHNLYPVLYARAFAEAERPRGSERLAFMRSGYTGSSAYAPMVWSGDPAASFEDSDGLPSVVRAGVNLGISGVPNYGSDIGGYHCVADGPRAADEELLVRWIQQAALTPNMQDQDACVGVPNPRRKATIWKTPLTLDVYRRYARLHTRLFPYLYALSVDASKSGAPPMRHPFLEHPDDEEQASVDDAYYLGPALFVAPVVERGARQRKVRLPQGVYWSWDEQRAFSGNREVTLDAPLDRLPLLQRSGSLVPLLDPTIDTLAEDAAPGVVGPNDVATVYDVESVLSEGQQATFELAGGDRFAARWQGPLDLPKLGARARSERDLELCDACFLLEHRADGVTRLRATLSASRRAGGLLLEYSGTRRIRWDIVLLPPDSG